MNTQVSELTEEIFTVKNEANKDERENIWEEVAVIAAHKLGNPIFSLEVFTDKALSRLRVGDTKTVQALLKKSLNSLEDAKQLIEEFRLLKTLKVEIKNADIVKCIETCAETFKTDGGKLQIIVDDITLAINTQSKVVDNSLVASFKIQQKIEFYFDENKIKHCFTELFNNAIRWLPKDRERHIIITLSKGGSVKSNSDLLKFIKINFQDNGPGVQEDKKDKIFQPFITTHPQGNGLGLSIVSKIIDLHGGEISESGFFGEGANFQILLPFIKK